MAGALAIRFVKLTHECACVIEGGSVDRAQEQFLAGRLAGVVEHERDGSLGDHVNECLVLVLAAGGDDWLDLQARDRLGRSPPDAHDPQCYQD